MNFDVYYAFKNAKGIWCPGIKPTPLSMQQILDVCKSENVKNLCQAYQDGDADAKRQLPAVCWHGKNTAQRRLDESMKPTQMVMIDIDHVENPNEAWRKMPHKRMIETDLLCVAHITCSGHGLRLVYRAWNEEFTNVEAYMNYLDGIYDFKKYGDFDVKCKNLGRLSFLVPSDYIIYWRDPLPEWEAVNPIVSATKIAPPAAKPAEIFSEGDAPTFTDDEVKQFEEFRYRGFELSVIVKKYLEVYGEPGPGEIHNYYNDMVKNFRNITSNNKRLLLYALPRFGHAESECWSQINSICRVNTLSRLPKQFYFFLKDNGFYQAQGQYVDNLKDYMLEEKEDGVEKPPFLPPVFRELIGCAPKDFILPAINSLLPILGTLTSYLRAIYPYDGREHSTSFFSVIYAPPGTGKGFVERYIDLLFDELKIRDFVQSERENVYLRMVNRKGANEKSPDLPHVSLRIIPPKNSEPEFLQKQRDNHGYHMFTYAAEMDSWAKGVRAAGGNKDDMIRIAWDNGEYGQQFKSANTFKGMVRLYWNVLITGTIAQVDSYFKNVENGLVTRCSFTSIENQEFAEPAVWKKLSKKALEVIKNFTKRCDENTYETPCDIMPEDLAMVEDDNFDKEVDWRFKFKEKTFVAMDWLMPTLNAFQKEQIAKAALDVDRARDVFRRRVGVRGFRLGIMCHALWAKPRKSDLEKCCQFIDWWMHQDIECMLKLWGAKYNEQTDVVIKVVQRTVFDALAETFSRTDVYNLCLKQGIKTPIRRIIFDWRKLKLIQQIDKNNFKKVQSNGQ